MRVTVTARFFLVTARGHSGITRRRADKMWCCAVSEKRYPQRLSAYDSGISIPLSCPSLETVEGVHRGRRGGAAVSIQLDLQGVASLTIPALKMNAREHV